MVSLGNFNAIGNNKEWLPGHAASSVSGYRFRPGYDY